MNENDKAWDKLFEKYKILSHIERYGAFKISAAQIKEFREPRLMTKFDHTVNLPEIFCKNKLSVLPITRGEYIISHFAAYHKFETIKNDVKKFSLPSHIQSLGSNHITSETIALNCAVVSGIIADFIGDDEIFATVNGRMGTGLFDFFIDDDATGKLHKLYVKNAQIEIDAAYEGINSLSLFEAKMNIEEDFLIRQLYYPYRVWKDRTDKNLKTIFIIYSNSIYHLYEYKFERPDKYNSLVLVKQQNYSLEDICINIEDIQQILKKTPVQTEPEIQFPQADNFERIINICELLNDHDLTRDDVTEQYVFVARQANYYADAARYLGLAEKISTKPPSYRLSAAGKRILRLSYKQRQLAYCKCILSHKLFADVLKKYFSCGIMPSTSSIIDMMKQSDLYNIKSDSTFRRRAATIRSWINWIVSLINE